MANNSLKVPIPVVFIWSVSTWSNVDFVEVTSPVRLPTILFVAVNTPTTSRLWTWAAEFVLITLPNKVAAEAES